MVGRVTIHDVAQLAGVSTTTVSNALTGAGRLSPGTREKVVATARALGYVASPTARSLRARRTGAVGLFLPGQSFGLEYYMNLAIGAAAEALDHGLALTLLPVSQGAPASPLLHVDGVVVSDPVLGDPFLGYLGGLNLPVVTCERDLTPAAQHAGRVESDHDHATRVLLEHLAARGAARIALLCPGGKTSFGHDIRRSYESWCAATGRDSVLHEVPFTLQPEDVRRAVEEALSAERPPDAIVSVPDGGAVSALQEVLRQGRRVPGDLMIASYVDSAALRGLPIPITAVDIAPREMGRRAVRLLARLITGESAEGSTEVLPTNLVIRASTSGSLL